MVHWKAKCGLTALHVGLCDGLKFGCRGGVKELLETWKIKGTLGVGDKPAESMLDMGYNGYDSRHTA